jgi:predicted dithiol-disulfide oxidoreductase (DUF899 family)
MQLTKEERMNHAVVPHEEWLARRRQLLAKEKDFTRLRDELTRRRQELPWELVEKDYVFDGADGPTTLSELFDGRSQLVVYHFMFDPDWEEGCRSCSFWADSFDANLVHLNAHDITFVAVSRAPFAKLAAYERRMGWTFPWLSSNGTDFNYDFGVSFPPDEQERDGAYNYGTQAPRGGEREGVSVFFADDGAVLHTYSSYARGIDLLNAAYNYIDLTPRGRDEDGRAPQSWVRRHDEYPLPQGSPHR